MLPSFYSETLSKGSLESTVSQQNDSLALSADDKGASMILKKYACIVLFGQVGYENTIHLLEPKKRLSLISQ